jgi:hypothetical protein
MHSCSKRYDRIDIRKVSIFESFGKDIKKILKILLRWCGGQPQHSILKTVSVSTPTLQKVLSILIMKIGDRKQEFEDAGRTRSNNSGRRNDAQLQVKKLSWAISSEQD